MLAGRARVAARACGVASDQDADGAGDDGASTQRGLGADGAAAPAAAHRRRPRPLDDRALTAAIKGCGSWEQLDSLLERQQQQARRLNALHASALLTHAAQLVARLPPARRAAALGAGQLPAFVQRAALVADALLPECDARGLANILWATASLQQAHGATRAWLARWAALASGRLGEFDAQQLSVTLWALAELEMGGAQQTAAGGSAGSSSSGGGGGGGSPVSGSQERLLVAAVVARLGQPGVTPRLTPQGASNAVWALAKLGAAPPADGRGRPFPDLDILASGDGEAV
ncbi:hypothetical protein MNEG_11656 [Monoraphidium neglectum]|uniref:Uncharacterized protein n=1 Tax=Monoraphidium neglectum TaxID=145388 RepID=A0A0D2KKH1_9CHLO|nr:hypothetical protein MNEG_11656 [Monoraphidium neglectum]KIY96308.1 hypothetical protein MNEG_11656 [Monoraphidium neglectum]|eukprot:XP_013895328.1 hypothetical protein MNEG_11656 [Monoraphidium neglectum]